ncbi:P-type ATPase, putative [Babesia ovata]|uniref:P-type ATPase, putative n=1 Tax=Babesia ovata TaxID=189622 RepID=A0A2H6KC26_9APIC|nr:P-type ATPase, putative [Babesia ovata]GBE60550.1 P-type ATPase, putative [Babesia ovata]
MKTRRMPSGRRERHTSRDTTDVDPEKREIFTTRKLGKVVDPKPLRVRIRDMPPGKKLCSAVALQLREAIDGASLTELGDISTMFAARLPLSGQLNDDTMELLAERFRDFSPEQLSTQMSHIALLSSAATARYLETWSHRRALGSTRASQAHRLYRIGRKQLPKLFLTKLSATAELYAKERVKPLTLGFRMGYHMDAVEQEFFTLRSLARSDMPLSMSLWDLLVAAAEERLETNEEVNLRCVIWLLEAINAAKYTTPSTIGLARRLIAKCKVPSDLDRNHIHIDTIDVAAMLRFTEDYSLGKDARSVIETMAGANGSLSDS